MLMKKYKIYIIKLFKNSIILCSIAFIFFFSSLIGLFMLLDETYSKILKTAQLQNIADIQVDLINLKNISFCIVAAIILQFIIIIVILLSMIKSLAYPLKGLYREVHDLGLSVSPIKTLPISYSKASKLIEQEFTSTFNKLNKLFSLVENINQNSSFSEILNYIYQSFSTFISYDYIGIALIDGDGEYLKAAYGISDGSLKGLPENLLGVKVRVSETSLTQVISEGSPRIINNLPEYTARRPLKYYNKVLLEAGINSSITLPLKANGKAIGIIFFSSKQKNNYENKHIKILNTLANSIAIAFQNNILLDDLLYSSVLALAKLAESRDEDTGEHLQRMKVYTVLITRMLFERGLYKDTIDIGFIFDIEKFSPLHDIGKVSIPDKILLKPSKLSPEEFEEMKQHTLYGAKVLKAANKNISKNGKPLFKMGLEIAEGHHEKWNGSGYPYGKKGEDIPLSARIAAIADVFDALTSIRPYKRAFSFQEAFEILIKESGKHFDPHIINIVQANEEELLNTYKKFNKN